MAFRYDLSNTTNAPKRLPDGRLRVDGAITRSGVFTYHMPDGSVRKEYRPEKEVFDPESMASFELLPFTDDHPPTRVDASNATRYTKGTTGESVRRVGDHLHTTIVVNDAATITKMEKGKRELSNGYDAVVHSVPWVDPDGVRYDGTAPNGETYHSVQTQIRGNHVALVDRARAGATARVRMDSDTAYMVDSDAKDTQMDLVALMAALTAANEKNASLSAEVETQRRRADAAEGALASARKDAAEAEKLRTDAAATFNDRVRDRAELVAVAATALRTDDGKPVEVSNLDDRAIQVAIVKRIDGDDLTDAKYSTDYIRAAYDGAVRRFKRGAASLATVRDAADVSRGAVPEDKEAKATEAMNKRRLDANTAEVK